MNGPGTNNLGHPERNPNRRARRPTLKRSEHRILTSHVGSLNRPPELLEMLERKYSGKPYDEAAYAAQLRSSVADVVKRQAEIGIDVPSDGEFGKVGFNHYPIERMT